jgi:hypothetical protein
MAPGEGPPAPMSLDVTMQRHGSDVCRNTSKVGIGMPVPCTTDCRRCQVGRVSARFGVSTRLTAWLDRRRALRAFSWIIVGSSCPTIMFCCCSHWCQDVNHVVLNANICKGAEQGAAISTQRRRGWIQLATTDRGLLDATFLSTCRSLVALQVPGRYYEQALKYKHDCIRSLNSAISREGRSPSASTIATTLALASDAVSCPWILRA